MSDGPQSPENIDPSRRIRRIIASDRNNGTRDVLHPPEASDANILIGQPTGESTKSNQEIMNQESPEKKLNIKQGVVDLGVTELPPKR